MPRYFTIKEASDYLGVTPDTLRRWEEEGKIKPDRTEGNHRRYLASELAGKEESDRNENPTLCYARVSTYLKLMKHGILAFPAQTPPNFL